MDSSYDAAEAQRYRSEFAAWGADLADRVYTSRLLGRDPALVLHGGGNTSVKSRSREVDGNVAVLGLETGVGGLVQRIHGIVAGVLAISGSR